MTNKIPSHIAIVMDGNGRWAISKGMERVAGHEAGVKTVRTVIQCCIEKGVKTLSLFAFSSENWNRPTQEVNFLMSLFLESLQAELNELCDKGIRLLFTGDRTKLSDELVQQMMGAENKSAGNTQLTLNVVINYGGRWDITQATRAIAEKVLNGALTLEQIDEHCCSQHLSTKSLSEPDLLIRTSGEKRISNFFLWQLAYTELYFCDELWPDFNQDSFDRAIKFFASRERRYGKVSRRVIKEENV
jgi:undecaprenyl diphosphate synthase